MSKVIIPVPERFHSEAYLSVIDALPSQLMLSISSHALEDMKRIAEQGYPDEICGLLIGKANSEGWVVNEVRQVANINEERVADRFALDPEGYQLIDRELRGSDVEIVGVFHSHPDCPAKPSPTDLQHAWEDFIYPIISVCGGEVAEVKAWVLSGDVGEGGCFQALRIQS